MALLKSAQVADNRPSLNSSQAGQVVVQPFSYTLAAALVDEDVVALAKLPAGHVPVDCYVNVPDLDTNGAPAIKTEFGIFENDATPTVVDTDAMILNSTAGQAAAVKRADAVAFLSLAPSDKDRIFGMRVETAPATGASAVTISGWFASRPADQDD
jgi:hypothetical protein